MRIIFAALVAGIIFNSTYWHRTGAVDLLGVIVSVFLLAGAVTFETWHGQHDVFGKWFLNRFGAVAPGETPEYPSVKCHGKLLSIVISIACGIAFTNHFGGTSEAQGIAIAIWSAIAGCYAWEVFAYSIWIRRALKRPIKVVLGHPDGVGGLMPLGRFVNAMLTPILIGTVLLGFASLNINLSWAKQARLTRAGIVFGTSANRQPRQLFTSGGQPATDGHAAELDAGVRPPVVQQLEPGRYPIAVRHAEFDERVALYDALRSEAAAERRHICVLKHLENPEQCVIEVEAARRHQSVTPLWRQSIIPFARIGLAFLLCLTLLIFGAVLFPAKRVLDRKRDERLESLEKELDVGTTDQKKLIEEWKYLSAIGWPLSRAGLVGIFGTQLLALASAVGPALLKWLED